VLVLTRKAGQKLLIGDDVEIIFLNSYEGQFKVGIDAPLSVKILRSEIKKYPEKFKGVELSTNSEDKPVENKVNIYYKTKVKPWKDV